MFALHVKRDAPCKDCQDRHAACHATCGRYGEWKKELDEREPEKRAQIILNEYAWQSNERFARRDFHRKKDGR